jgi:hypothetical protein
MKIPKALRELSTEEIWGEIGRIRDYARQRRLEIGEEELERRYREREALALAFRTKLEAMHTELLALPLGRRAKLVERMYSDHEKRLDAINSGTRPSADGTKNGTIAPVRRK